MLAEKQLSQKVLGVAFDGTGYGDDGKLWGGEFLLCDFQGFARVAHLKEFKLLGGVKAIKEPKRVALSLLFECYGKSAFDLENEAIKAFSAVELQTLYKAWQNGLNAPFCTSVGRLFDGVASLLGVVQVMYFEGESGMLLEELYDEHIKDSYDIAYQDGVIDFIPMIDAIVHEKERKVAVSRFFNTLVEIIVQISRTYTLPLVLSGGVFQNRVLVELILQRFPDAIFSHEIPPNDGGIALGQVASVFNQT